jgi:hypothetical protein
MGAWLVVSMAASAPVACMHVILWVGLLQHKIAWAVFLQQTEHVELVLPLHPHL